MDAKFTVVIKNNRPWLKWEQYETTFLKIWKAKSNEPYVKYMGMIVKLTDDMKAQLQKIINKED